MASRRRAREFALQALYLADINQSDAVDALRDLWAGQIDEEELTQRPAEKDEITFAEQLVAGARDQHNAVDTMIEKASRNWRLSRMPVVDRNILRIATYELLARDDVPASVSINEAVELAKKFGDKDSRAFVNGILDRIAAETGRGGRHHTSKKTVK